MILLLLILTCIYSKAIACLISFTDNIKKAKCQYADIYAHKNCGELNGQNIKVYLEIQKNSSHKLLNIILLYAEQSNIKKLIDDKYIYRYKYTNEIGANTYFKLKGTKAKITEKIIAKEELSNEILKRITSVQKQKNNRRSIINLKKEQVEKIDEGRLLKKARHQESKIIEPITHDAKKGNIDSKPVNINRKINEYNRQQYYDSPLSTIMKRPMITHSIKKPCEPIYEEEQNRVLIRYKKISYSGKSVIKVSPCNNVLTYHKIHKDFKCTECNPRIDTEEMRAYPRYRKYWMNNEAKKIYVNDSLYTDNENPYKIETDECLPEVNIENNKVYYRKSHYYLNKRHEKVVVEDCHVTNADQFIPIQYKLEGCGHNNNYDAGWTILRKIAYYVSNGEEIVVQPCMQFGEPLQHQYDYEVCNHEVNPNTRKIIRKARRYVSYNHMKVYVKDTCDPEDEINLTRTQEGCFNQYLHKIDEGRSYPLIRWFYEIGAERLYVTNCQQSDEYIPHQSEVVGYKHSDDDKATKIQKNVYIEDDNGKQSLSIDASESVPYHFIKNKQYTGDDYYYEGCYRFTRSIKRALYKRADNTYYEEDLGEGQPIRGGDECIREYEKRKVYIASLFKDLRTGEIISKRVERKPIHNTLNKVPFTQNYIRKKLYKIERRTVIKYPDGHIEKSDWEEHDTYEE